MSTFLPQDSNDYPIPAMRLKNSGAHSISATSTTARNTTAFDGDKTAHYTHLAVLAADGDGTVYISEKE